MVDKIRRLRAFSNDCDSDQAGWMGNRGLDGEYVEPPPCLLPRSAGSHSGDHRLMPPQPTDDKS
jgi:hypothetical protein